MQENVFPKHLKTMFLGAVWEFEWKIDLHEFEKVVWDKKIFLKNLII